MIDFFQNESTTIQSTIYMSRTIPEKKLRISEQFALGDAITESDNKSEAPEAFKKQLSGIRNI
jgi:hypothetical protein